MRQNFKINFLKFLEYIDEKQFHETIDKARSHHLREKIKDKWHLKYKIINKLIN